MWFRKKKEIWVGFLHKFQSILDHSISINLFCFIYSRTRSDVFRSASATQKSHMFLLHSTQDCGVCLTPVLIIKNAAAAFRWQLIASYFSDSYDWDVTHFGDSINRNRNTIRLCNVVVFNWAEIKLEQIKLCSWLCLRLSRLLLQTSKVRSLLKKSLGHCASWLSYSPEGKTCIINSWIQLAPT